MRSIGPSRARARTRLLATSGLVGALVVAASGRIAHTAEPGPRSAAVDLAERLKAGLGVQAPADVAFCDTVARHVREGRLPRHLVDSTYTWSLQRGKKYPFPAFEHVIRIKAARLGVAF